MSLRLKTLEKVQFLNMCYGRQEDLNQKVVGSDPSAGKSFFKRNLHVKVNSLDHLVVEFEHFTSLSCVMNALIV